MTRLMIWCKSRMLIKLSIRIWRNRSNSKLRSKLDGSQALRERSKLRKMFVKIMRFRVASRP